MAETDSRRQQRPAGDDPDPDRDESGTSDTEDVFAAIHGHQDVKLVLRRALTGGDTHVLLVGPPGCGKSLFLEELEERVPGCLLRDVKNLSPAKLRARFAEDHPILLLDELDKFKRSSDYDVMNMPLEHGRVQKDTAHETYDIEIGTQVVATANHKDSIPDQIVSRFKIVELEKYTVGEYLDVCEHMLVEDDQSAWIDDGETARDLAKMVHEVTDSTDPRNARDIARDSTDMDSAKDLTKALGGVEIDKEVSLSPDEVARAETEVAREELRQRIRAEVRGDGPGNVHVDAPPKARGNGAGAGGGARPRADASADVTREHIDAEIETVMAQTIDNGNPNRDFETAEDGS